MPLIPKPSAHRTRPRRKRTLTRSAPVTGPQPAADSTTEAERRRAPTHSKKPETQSGDGAQEQSTPRREIPEPVTVGRPGFRAAATSANSQRHSSEAG